MFTLMPETHVATIISDIMIYNESIIITDTEKFAEGEGYGWDFKFKAAYNDS